LAQEVEGIDPEYSSCILSDDSGNKDSASVKKKISVLDSLDMADRKTREVLRNRIHEIQEEIREPEELNDLGTKEKLLQELAALEDYYDQNFGKGGKARKFSDPSKKTKNRITKSIERALKAIKKHDEKVWLHFHDALRPVNSYEQSYQPTRDIDWKTYL
jgi:hypothetical protein